MKLTNEITEAINNLKLAKAMEEEAKLLKSHAQSVLTPAMTQANITEYSLDEGGSIVRVPPGESKSLNKDKLKTEFLHHGIDALIIRRCFDAAYDTKSRAGYIRYTPPKH